MATLSRYVHDFDAPPGVAEAGLVRLLGGKGANLVVMAGVLQLPVPPGFTITTEACREYLAGTWPPTLDAELHTHMARLGELAGRRFGDEGDPLLVSVRSGAPVSMPGMMDTVLNLGLNEATAAGLARVTGDASFAADCLRRFREGYRAVIGTDVVPDDPWQQLRAAIEAVFRSWNSERAIAYRRRERISDELGTAVTVQAMVFGNRGPDSATGVLFTRNPSTGERVLYGDVMFNAQGEDVVAGGHEPEPLSVLDTRLPDVAGELRRDADLLERHYGDLCDIEFTIEQRRLWLLQVRVGKRSPAAALRMAVEMAEDQAFPCTREEAVRRVGALLADPPRTFVPARDAPAPIATGLPASPGFASGTIVLDSDAAEREAAGGRAVILVRSETSPDDVRGMARAAGVLTARGGLASHAAVVARGWGIPAVVGASSVVIGDRRVDIDGRSFDEGDRITIDGSTGEIFAGEVAGTWQVAPEAATLLQWASERGVDIGQAPDTTAGGTGDRAAEPTSVEVAADDVVRTLLVKGSVTPEQLADAMGSEVVQIAPLLDRLSDEGLAEGSGGNARLTAAGKLRALELMAADRAAIGQQRSVELLDEFHALDGRMKEIVTAWQVRDVAGEQVLNDHSDSAYDAQVLDNLHALHGDTAEWLEPLCASMRRYAVYRTRLSRSLDLARGGDQRFVASPRVDSYHSVWFELHEDLIRLAGQKRSG